VLSSPPIHEMRPSPRARVCQPWIAQLCSSARRASLASRHRGVDIDHRAEHLLAPGRTEHDRLAIVETQPVTADDLVDELDELDEPAARLQQRCPATEGQVVT
jgi:hypothetical protein